MNPMKNEIGNQYGKLKVIEKGGQSPAKATRWVCLCECGNKTEVIGYSLRKGITTSCGCNRGRKEEFEGSAVYKKSYTSLKRISKKHKEKLELSLEEWMEKVNDNCFYCGLPPQDIHFSYSKKRYSKGIDEDNRETFNGIDRIDSSIGYTLDNTVSCCNMCNRMKSDFLQNEFFNKIELIYIKWKTKTQCAI
jgi:hypothetical protein